MRRGAKSRRTSSELRLMLDPTGWPRRQKILVPTDAFEFGLPRLALALSGAK